MDNAMIVVKNIRKASIGPFISNGQKLVSGSIRNRMEENGMRSSKISGQVHSRRGSQAFLSRSLGSPWRS